MDNTITERAKEHFNEIVVEQLASVERMKEPVEWTDFAQVKPIIFRIFGGDRIGPLTNKIGCVYNIRDCCR